MKRILLLTILVCAAANANAAPAPVSPLQPKASSVSEVEAKSLETQKETDLLKNIDAILSGKFDKASEYRPPLPLTQKAWSRQKTETKAGTKIFVWSRGKTFKVTLREGMGTLFKLPDWDGLDQSVLADSVNFRQKEMNNSSMIYVEALSAGADTNLTLIGKSGNIYSFYLASESVYSDNISDQVVYVDAAMPSVQNFFDNTSDLKRKESVESFEKLTKNEKTTWLNELKFDPTKIRHDVEMRGDKELAPVLVFRDERFTYLDYGHDSDSRVWPVAYQVVYVDAAMPSVQNFFDNTSDLKRKESVENFEKLTKNEKTTWLNELKFDPTKIRHDVEMRGDKELAPVLVFRDERFTYLDYGHDSDSRVWPVAYQVVDRVDQPVNMRKSPDGRYMVIETINPITLRYGEKTVCLKRKN